MQFEQFRTSKVITTKQQFALMVELLQQKPEMAQGFTKFPKEEAAAFWNNMAQELNSVGPPTKDISSWKKQQTFSNKPQAFSNGPAQANNNQASKRPPSQIIQTPNKMQRIYNTEVTETDPIECNNEILEYPEGYYESSQDYQPEYNEEQEEIEATPSDNINFLN
ncbi:uncharacterized protein LOC126766008 [Bactrocera neohumeralis]|uniref:uncharacterized protein LOC126766008 n=1 Tax=Bactrocera neohumeralis TaxID=98809 RepID=UPI0021665E1E|nr:uncharacterized protein LOC126766008 [Bactrocera neohumeralis]